MACALRLYNDKGVLIEEVKGGVKEYDTEELELSSNEKIVSAKVDVCNHMPVNLTFMVYEIIDYQTS